ncbi:uncharacterized protein LOC143275290 [Babylonia areolata]|uniref:uncharacterized protein LOC143275290 n=1 Tax=Babylonia areolata TaxID=304850 RepID=UPI003FD368D6
MNCSRHFRQFAVCVCVVGLICHLRWGLNVITTYRRTLSPIENHDERKPSLSPRSAQVGQPSVEPGPPLNNSAMDLQVEIFPHWTTKDPHDKTIFPRMYLYSAIMAVHRAPSNGTDIHVVAFQDGKRLQNLTCCAKLAQSQHVHSGMRAKFDFSYQQMTSTAHNYYTVGVVYRCWFPFSSQELREGHVTLAPTSCPENEQQYLTVHQPALKPGGLAICAKIAYGVNLNPNKLVEWFETQRILGVDRIQLFDLNNTEMVLRILRHYEDTGLLDLLPYALPGRPWGRSLLNKKGTYARFGDDEELVLWDCRLRLAGYDYVMDVDTDEVIMPRNFKTLKPFFKQQFARHPKACSLSFKVQFFLDHWGPVVPEAPLLFLRYLNSTYPGAQVSKLVYLPCRTHQAKTHVVHPYPGYRMFRYVSTSEGTVFHYRSCKPNWTWSCDGPRLTDTSMQRFEPQLVAAVSAVQRKVGLSPA